MQFTALKQWIQSQSPCCLCGNKIHRISKLNPPLLCTLCHRELPRLAYGTDVLNSAAAEQLKCEFYDGLAIVGLYDWPYNLWLPGLKFQRHLYVAPLLGFYMARQIEQQEWLNIDLLCALPLHSDRWLMRGYNQALLLTEAIQRELSIPIFSGLVRIKSTLPQSKLNRLERLNNTNNAFVGVTPIDNKNVLLVDDVITTGSSVNDACRALKNAGANKVYVTCGAFRILH